MKAIALMSLLLLAGCGSCLDPFNKLSDCPRWSHDPADYGFGHHADRR